MEHVLSSSNSPDLKILERCLVIAGRLVPNKSAICCCVSQTVSFSRRTSSFIVSFGWYRTISLVSICESNKYLRHFLNYWQWVDISGKTSDFGGEGFGEEAGIDFFLNICRFHVYSNTTVHGFDLSGCLPARRRYFPKGYCLFGLPIIEEIKWILTNIYKDNEFETNKLRFLPRISHLRQTNYAIKGYKKQRDKQIYLLISLIVKLKNAYMLINIHLHWSSTVYGSKW